MVFRLRSNEADFPFRRRPGRGNVRRRGRTFIKFSLSVEQVIARMTRDNLIFDAKALILLK